MTRWKIPWLYRKIHADVRGEVSFPRGKESL